MRARHDPTATGVECENCGLGKGHYIGRGGSARCDECGQFAQATSDYCAKHDVNVRRIGGYSTCPACEEERRVDQMEQEMMARRADPRMHPTVDAPRF